MKGVVGIPGVKPALMRVGWSYTTKTRNVIGHTRKTPLLGIEAVLRLIYVITRAATAVRPTLLCWISTMFVGRNRTM